MSVNVARVRANPDLRAQSKLTGIDKVAATEPVMVRAPGSMHGGLGSGLVGDTIGNHKVHGGDDQAVYAYAREDLERWRIGTEGLVLEVSAPRTPCRTFAAFLHLNQWIKTFTQAGKPGAYLRVISPGAVRAGDPIAIDYRPDHDVTIGLVFRARMTEPELLPRLLVADALSAELKSYARRRVASSGG